MDFSLNLKKMIIVFTAILFQFGCASKGFNRGELKEQTGVIKPVFDDKEIKDAYNKKANLPKPFKLAVYFKNPKAKHGETAWRWTDQDKNILVEIGKELKAKGLVADVFPLAGAIIESEDLKSLRLAAAKHQADALLVISGAGDIDRYINKWGWSYAFIVPAFFVPGSKADTLFMANATLWDVKNEYLYLTAESESTLSDTYVAAFGKEDKELLTEAKTQAMGQLKQEITNMINGNKL